MNLTDKEKELIIQSIKENRPISKEYLYKMYTDEEDVFLFWNGRKEEVTNIALPFHHIEHIDEPRKEDAKGKLVDMFDVKGRQKTGWHNKLIWGDNKLILSSLANGPLREEIEKEGGLKLVYIDPPFAVGSDFSHTIELNGETATKSQSVLEEIAYRDTWQRGISSYLSMMYERIKLIYNLLAKDGSLYIHCDSRVNSYLRILLDDIFSKENFRNEIIWQKIRVVKAQSLSYGNVNDSIFYYGKSKDSKLINQFTEQDSDYEKKFDKIDKEGNKYQLVSLIQKGAGPARRFGDRLISPPAGMHWIWSQERIDEALKNDLIEFTSTGNPRKKQFLDESKGKMVDSLWVDIFPVNSQAIESVSYPTQKPESLLERIINASSNEGDLIADFFCGSGTTAAVAEKLNRKWITTDLGRFAIHTTRKRMIGVQRDLKENGKDFRAFEILNLGKYERQFFIDDLVNGQRKRKEEAYLDLICRAYSAQRIENYATLHAKKSSRFVHIGPLDMPVTQTRVQEIFEECRTHLITQVDVLGFEFEMGLQPRINQEFKEQGVDIRLRYIPKDVFDPRAVDKGQVKFYDVSYLQAKPIQNGNKVKIELVDFVTNYTQDDIEDIQENMKAGSKVVIENGQIIKVNKDKNGIIQREVLTENWHDWIDYWSVDFDYLSKKEIIRFTNESGQIEEQWTGNYIFENEWQSFRTKQNRELEFVSAEHLYAKPGHYKVMVKVVDILGVDTSQIIDVKI